MSCFHAPIYCSFMPFFPLLETPLQVSLLGRRPKEALVCVQAVQPATPEGVLPEKEHFDCFDYCVYCEYGLERFSRGDINMTLPAHSKPLRASGRRSSRHSDFTSGHPQVRSGRNPEANALGGRLPSADEKADANQLRKILASQMATGAKIRVLDPNAPNKTAEITLAPALAGLMTEMLRHIAKGDAVTLVPVSQMLTTQQAADVLNVSRPFLISLLKKNEIAYELVGRHRRIKPENLFAYKDERDKRRSQALSELAAIDADLI